MKNGFYTALGTPVDNNGSFMAESFEKHVADQVKAGASGLLAMGTMGNQAAIKQEDIRKVAESAVKAADGKCPVLVGIMDNSIARAKNRVELLKGLDIQGIVSTAPFYFALSQEEMIEYFEKIADISPYPLYLYDLAVVTKTKITLPVIDRLINHPNIKGIKTADWEMIQAIGRKYPDVDFQCFYSGLDSFDYANMMNIKKNLDGMFSCTPKNGKKMFECLKTEDFLGARKYLDNILLLRDTMLAQGLMMSFTYCMNQLGCEGNFHQDYCLPISDESKKILTNTMKNIGEL